MKITIKYDTHRGIYVIAGANEIYIETFPAQPTSRVLDGSSDHGYWAEYIGYGNVYNIPVKAVYLLDEDQAEIEDESDYDWDDALNNGRLEIDIDDISDDAMDILQLIVR